MDLQNAHFEQFALLKLSKLNSSTFVPRDSPARFRDE
jgi:hypothetical protein